MLSHEEIQILATLKRNHIPNLTPLAKLFAIREPHSSATKIAEVVNGSRLISEILPDHTLPDEMLDEDLLVSAIDRQLTVVQEHFGDPRERKVYNIADDDVPEDLINLLDDLELFYSDYDRLALMWEADNRALPKIDLEILVSRLKKPVWNFKEFAAYSMGRTPAEHPRISKGPVAREQARRLRVMEMANSLPLGHPQHLPLVATPQELMDWAIDGERFKIHQMMLDCRPRSSREYLELQLSNAEARINELEERLSQKTSGSEAKENDSLRKLCIGLTACIRRPASAQDSPLFSPQDDRSRFFENLRTWMGHVLDPSDLLHADTIRKHLRESFNHLSGGSRKAWNEKKVI
ncbi:hypothetical protein ONR75_03230 [Rhodopseudomonas sp. P2A-2r]|uniref:hypothetical protein n=1 Tax=Rhodopseudomonas sp. P2A-2r TaxID=2991972 RepID=UPI0022340C29|nr:hypothetical protein [Rhodopseudomonas sp. P2A-2r]UZE49824.1 hypothetical protein ONR75_03230 [Rhodopseudomonas sp. P2A-2r]